MTTSLWPAPRARAPVDAVVAVPGSKSMTVRALALGALADGPGKIENPLAARDTALMVGGLRALGAQIDTGARAIDDPAPAWTVRPHALHGGGGIDCGLSGTVARFLPAVAALAAGSTTLTGDPYARERPIAPLLSALRELGVSVDAASGDRLPITVHGTGAVRGGSADLDATASSQFVSGILLAAPRFDTPTTLRLVAGVPPSRPYVDMTLAMLRDRGVVVSEDTSARTWRVEPGPIAARDTTIEPDLPNAAAFLAAALVTGGRVRIPHWPLQTTQAGDRLRTLCADLGARVRLDEDGLTVEGGPAVEGVDVDLRDASELLVVLAAVAALARGPSRIRGVAHVRGHESDRLAAVATELSKLGGDVREESDGLTIHPRPLRGGVVSTYDDHRMVTFGAVLGLVVDHVEVENLGATTKTLPDFANRWRRMLAGAPQ